MSIYENIPVVDMYELEKALNLQYGENFNEIPVLLFGDDYMGGVCKPFFFDKMEVFSYPQWQNEEEIRLRNLVRAYFQDVFPERNMVLIHIYW